MTRLGHATDETFRQSFKTLRADGFPPTTVQNPSNRRSLECLSEATVLNSCRKKRWYVAVHSMYVVLMTFNSIIVSFGAFCHTYSWVKKKVKALWMPNADDRAWCTSNSICLSSWRAGTGVEVPCKSVDHTRMSWFWHVLVGI